MTNQSTGETEMSYDEREQQMYRKCYKYGFKLNHFKPDMLDDYGITDRDELTHLCMMLNLSLERICYVYAEEREQNHMSYRRDRRDGIALTFSSSIVKGIPFQLNNSVLEDESDVDRAQAAVNAVCSILRKHSEDVMVEIKLAFHEGTVELKWNIVSDSMSFHLDDLNDFLDSGFGGYMGW